MNFQPRDPNFQKKVRDSFDQQQFMEHIGATLVEVRPGYCEIRVPFQESLTQQNGFFHAGVISTIADNSAGYAAFSLMAVEASVLTVEFKLNLLSPGKGDMLIGRGQVLKSGKTLTVCRSDLFVVQNGKEKLCAAGQSTLIQLLETPDQSS
ncbi:MAG: PaaI family thioesterase [Bacteroidota bacterium]